MNAYEITWAERRSDIVCESCLDVEEVAESYEGMPREDAEEGYCAICGESVGWPEAFDDHEEGSPTSPDWAFSEYVRAGVEVS